MVGQACVEIRPIRLGGKFAKILLIPEVIIFILMSIPKVLSSRSLRRLGGSKWFNAKIRYGLSEQMDLGFFRSSIVFHIFPFIFCSSYFFPSLDGVDNRLQIFHSSFVLAAFFSLIRWRGLSLAHFPYIFCFSLSFSPVFCFTY